MMVKFCENDIPKNGRCLFVFVSQSGETMDKKQRIDLLKLKIIYRIAT